MPLDRKLTKFTTQGPFNASFDFVDLATGSAYGTFLAADATDGNLLTGEAIYSNLGWTTGAGTWTFPITFNLGLTMNGLAYLEVPIFFNSPSGTQNVAVRVTPSIKIDSTTIATGTLHSETKSTTAGTTLSEVYAWNIELPKTRIKPDQQLILSLEVSVSQSSGSVVSGIQHDPKDRDINAAGANFITSILKLQIPFIP